MRLFKNKKIRILLQLLLFILIFIFISKWQQRGMLEDQTAINVVTLKTLQSEKKAIFNSQEKPKKLIYFFAPWCSICRISMPKLSYLSKDDLEIYAVALSYDSQKQVENFINEIKYEGDVLLGSPEITSQFKVNAFPSYYVLNKDNKIIHKGLGMASIISIWWQTL